MSKEIVIMFFVILVEYACFPISSELVLPISGGVAKSHSVPFLFVLLISVLAGTIGVCFTYAVGRYGGSPLMERIMQRFPRTKKPILASYRFFGDHGNSAACFGRLVPICRTYISFISGATNRDFGSYLLYSSIGITLWNAFLLSIGYYFMQYKDIVFTYYNNYKTLVLFSAGTIVVLFILHKLAKPAEEF
ncbi:MAG: DedA family protein [Lachnoclostridium sp.]|jgi:membrane protein DedA with SNARE-associated domain|nr:DedA family protein [Lachnoclostridium sp.]